MCLFKARTFDSIILADYFYIFSCFTMTGSDFSCAVLSRALGCDSICIYSVDYLINLFQASISYLCYLLIAYCHLVKTGILLLLRNFSTLFGYR